jgi:Methyltransferase TRM13
MEKIMDACSGGRRCYDCDNHPTAQKSKISSVSGYDVQRLLFKIQRAKSHLPRVDSISKSDLRNDSNPYSANRPAKHIGQVESIIAHMQRSGFFAELQDDDNEVFPHPIKQAKRCHFIEFGCGTAKLSDHVSMYIACQKQQKEKQAASLKDAKPIQYRFILIDRQPMKAVERYCDGRMRSRRLSSSSDRAVVQRFVSPISEINLWKILHDESLAFSSEFENVAVAMSKHLCGSATDDAIECLQIYRRDCSFNAISHDHTPKSARMSLIPLIFATCCHYACHADTFMKTPQCIVSRHRTADKDCDSMSELSYLQHLGFDQRDIEVIIIISQWASIKIDEQTLQGERSAASCSESNKMTNAIMRFLFDPSAGARATKLDVFPPMLPEHPIPLDIFVSDEWIPAVSFEQRFSRVEKSFLGKYSKILLDTARAYYLKYHCGYKEVQLIHYTTLSSERNLLIATL